MKLVVGISGASGVSLAQKFITKLPKNIEVHIIQSEHSEIVFEKEEHLHFHKNSNIAASIASGSFGVDAMIILPCSTNTLAKIAVGINDNLLTRSASVMLKEQKKLLLAVREMPLSSIVLENMTKLSQLGVIIAPPIIGYYSEQQTLEDMENFLIGKWFDLLGIENELFKRWDGK